jgi:hypothetical protein
VSDKKRKSGIRQKEKKKPPEDMQTAIGKHNSLSPSTCRASRSVAATTAKIIE